MSRRLRSLLLVGALTVAPTVVAPPVARAAEPPRPSTELASLPCRDLLLITVRGSGDAEPEGEVLPAFREHVLARFPSSASSVWLDYPAASTRELSEQAIGTYLFDGVTPSSAYFDSVAQGTRELTRVLAHSVAACPQQKVAILAYSQGALVATRTLATSPAAGNVSATLLLGNPAHHPGQAARELDGQVDTPALGVQATMDYLLERERQAGATTHDARVSLVIQEVLALNAAAVPNSDIANALRNTPNAIPATAYSTTMSVCAKGDMVCDFVPALSRLLAGGTMTAEADRARPVHGGYTPGQAERSLSLVSSMLRQPRPRPTASPNPSPGSSPAVPSAGRRTGWQEWAIGAALLLTGAAAGFAAGRRRRRRVSGRS